MKRFAIVLVVLAGCGGEVAPELPDGGHAHGFERATIGTGSTAGSTGGHGVESTASSSTTGAGSTTGNEGGSTASSSGSTGSADPCAGHWAAPGCPCYPAGAQTDGAPCGDPGQVCQDGSCYACGGEGQTCCFTDGGALDGCSVGSCVVGTCRTCGGPGQACCASGSACFGGAFCSDRGTCDVPEQGSCGAAGQACCYVPAGQYFACDRGVSSTMQNGSCVCG